jgi:hypothetical protein
VLDCFGLSPTHIEGPAPTLACADAEAHPVLGEEARRELAFGSSGNERMTCEADLPLTILASKPLLPTLLPMIDTSIGDRING